MQKKDEELKAGNDRMKREIEALKGDRRYLESIARRDFGLVRPNEVIYKFPATQAPAGNQQPPQPQGQKK
jgi:cell division protein FtsB